MVKRDNYELALQAAQKRFCSYDTKQLLTRSGVTDRGEYLQTRFVGAEVLICKKTGVITVDGEPADFCETLSILDWLCDRDPDAQASGEFCPVSSLPGIWVGGSGLMMAAPELAQQIEKDPKKYQKVIKRIWGKFLNSGDIGVEFQVFPDLPMQIKFFFSDEEFPPSLTFMWDKNSLQFVRYETLYYICGVVQKHLLRRMRQ